MWIALVLFVLWIVFSFLAVTFRGEYRRIEYMGLETGNADYRYYYDLFGQWERWCTRASIASFLFIPIAIYIEVRLF